MNVHGATQKARQVIIQRAFAAFINSRIFYLIIVLSIVSCPYRAEQAPGFAEGLD